MSDMPPPPPPPSPGPGGPPPAAGQKVGPWPRFGARIIDAIVLLIPIAVINSILGVNTFGSSFGADDVGKVFIAGIVNAALTLAYFAWMESTQGKTVGKMVLNMQVYGPGGGHPTVEQSLKRNGFYAIQAIPVLGGLVAFVLVIVIAVGISNDPRGQGPHDRFADGTLVTRT